MFLYQCEDSLEGIFTAIYNIYEDKRNREEVMVCTDEENLLFAEAVMVQTDVDKAEKVIRTLRRQFGEEDYYSLCLALASEDERKAQAVYRTVAKGITAKCRKGHLLDDLSDEWVHLAFALGRAAGREYDHLRGFLRFEELEQGILYAQIEPKNRILPFLMNHFADRFPKENFMIYDESRKILGIHEAGDFNHSRRNSWYLVQCGEELTVNVSTERSETERAYQKLFHYFCQKIAIQERRNLNLQRNMLPLRYREYMTEFKQEN